MRVSNHNAAVYIGVSKLNKSALSCLTVSNNRSCTYWLLTMRWMDSQDCSQLQLLHPLDLHHSPLSLHLSTLRVLQPAPGAPHPPTPPPLALPAPASTTNLFEFINSVRGKPKLLHDGYHYSLHSPRHPIKWIRRSRIGTKDYLHSLIITQDRQLITFCEESPTLHVYLFMIIICCVIY